MKIKPFLPKLHIDIERWKYLKSMDVYISSHGRFKDKEGNILSVGAKNNYLIFRGESVHRLVLSTFKPVPGWAGLTVDHLNHNTRDNRIANLEWVTESENRRRAQEDNSSNVKTMLEETEAKFKKDIKASAYAVKLNSVVVPLDVAQGILCNDKSLKAGVSKIKETFKKIANGETTATEISIGNHKIEILRTT